MPHRWRLLTVLTVLVLLAAACGNSGDDTSSTTSGGSTATTAGGDVDTTKFVPLDEPGVTDQEIRVSVVASKTNPLGTDYSKIADGVNAYFDMVNSEGGLYGRDLVVAKVRDDLLAQNLSEVQGALAQDNPFAVVISTLLFTGAEELAAQGVPTFGWNINPEWSNKDDMFPNLGALCFGCSGRLVPWLAQQVGAKKVGIVAYGVSDQSKKCAEGDRKSFETYGDDVGGISVGFYDDSLAFGQADMRAQAEGIKKAGVDFVTTCMDLDGVKTLADALRAVQWDVTFEHPNMYNQDFVAENQDLFNGDYVVPQFLAFEQENPPAAMQQFMEWTDRAGVKVEELTMIGWIAADQLVTGLKAAGPEFSRQKVIDALNTMTYDAGGLIVPIDWTKQHNDSAADPSQGGALECANFVHVENGEFVPVFATSDGPWVCFQNDGTADPPYAEPTNMSFAGE